MRTSGREQFCIRLAALYLAFVLLCAVAAADDTAGIDEKLAAIIKYERGMDTQPLIAVEQLIRDSQNQPGQRRYIERKLAESLAAATPGRKSFSRNELWFFGRPE